MKTHPKDFVMLEDVLDGLFDRSLAELPKGKLKYAESPYFPRQWDSMVAMERLIEAQQLDRQRNPALQPLWEKLEKAQSEITEYEQSETTTALNITEKNKQLMRIRNEEERLDILLFGPLKDALVAVKEIEGAGCILHSKHREPQKQRIIDQRVNAIVETANEFEFDLQSIPYGGKKKIKEKCLNDAMLFTEPTFDKAWQEAVRQSLVKVKNAESYRKRY